VDRSASRWLIAIVALSILLRAGAAFYLGDIVDVPPLLTDQRAYHRLAVRLVQGHGFSFAEGSYPFIPPETPTAHWSFLESLFVAAVYRVFGIHPLAARLAHAVLGGILLPWMVYRLTRRLFPPSRAKDSLRPDQTGRLPKGLGDEVLPLLSALLAAVYFYFVLYAATIMTETFYIVALLWSLERAIDLTGFRKPVRSLVGSAAALGLGLGIATLLRQSILPWAAVLFAWLLWTGIRAPRRSNCGMLASLGVAGFVVLACILPFTIRNYSVYGRFLLLNSNAGYAMYSAQHPMHGTSFREFDAAPPPQDLQGDNEAEWDRDLMRRGVGFVIAEPGRYLLLSLSRVRDYFEFWPTRDTTLLHNIGRVGSFGLFLPFMLYGIWLAVRKARAGPPPQAWADLAASPLGLALLFLAFYSLLHIFTWAMPRYRLPVDAVALPFAALGLVDLVGRVAARRRSTPAREGDMA
jgi:hypothetical protein